MECDETHKIVELSAVLLKLIIEERGEIATNQRLEEEKDLLSSLLVESSGDLDAYRSMLLQIHSDIESPPTPTPQNASSSPSAPKSTPSSNNNNNNAEDWSWLDRVHPSTPNTTPSGSTPNKPTNNSNSSNNKPINNSNASNNNTSSSAGWQSFDANKNYVPSAMPTSLSSSTKKNNTNGVLSNTELLTHLSHYIEEKRSVEEVKGFMKEHGIGELNDWDEDGIPPLVRAILIGREDLVEELIDIGADVNFHTKKGTNDCD